MLARCLSCVAVLAMLSTPAVAQSRYTLKGDSVAIYNLVGELRVEPGSGGDVVVQVTRGGEDSAKLDIQTGPLRGRETLRVLYPDDVIVVPEWGRGSNTTMHVRDDGTFGDTGDHHHHGWYGEGREVRITGRDEDGLDAHADLRVSVPAGKGVALYLGVGKAFVSNVDGAIRVSVASADVAADRTRGSLRVETGSGNVDVRTASGDVNLETGSGDITLAAMAGSRLKLETGSGNVTLSDAKSPDFQVETGSGDIEATGASGDDVSFETGSGDVRVALVTTFQSLHIQTGSGEVTLKVPANLGAEVDLDTGSGDIDLGGLAVQVRRIQHDHVVGTIGDGKARLTVETGSGDVHLQKL
jgi:hypothetical protein